MLNALLSDAFPFHVRVDERLRLVSWGRSAAKVFPRLRHGMPLGDALSVLAPVMSLSSSALSDACDATILAATGAAGVQLRGQFWPTPEGGFAFLCSPWFDDHAAMRGLELCDSDFAPHESSLDYLALKSMRARQLAELHEQNVALRNAATLSSPRAADAARAEQMVLLETLEQAIEAVIMVDAAGTITFFSQAARILFGYARRDAVGRHIGLLSCGDDSDNAWLDTSNGSHYRGEVTLARYDGTPILCSYSVSRVTSGDTTMVTAFVQDITEQRRTEQRISHQAHHDGLTGLPNRRGFQRHLEERFRAGKKDRTAVALVDLDNFKAVNDLLGHGAGDEFLKITAKRIARSIRDSDFASRLGGDEFAVILNDVTSRAAADRIMSRVLKDLQQSMTIGDEQWLPAASVGVATGDACATATDALRNADLAMYEAKALGKGQVFYFNEALSQRALARVELQRKLKAALAAGEIVAFFQPIIDLEVGRTMGFEALARWTPPNAKPVSPAEFIPVAETSDLILEVERAVLDHALSTLAILRKANGELTVHVNISPRHMANAELIATVAELLHKHAVPADALTLELTESTLLGDSPQVREQFERLGELGVRVALDDFGTGYSSLSYLERYSFDALKVDRSFVTDIANTDVRRRLVEIMLGVGQVLEMQVVAEGIETLSDQAVLQGMQCRYGQGFLYAAPMPAAELGDYLRAEQPRAIVHSSCNG